MAIAFRSPNGVGTGTGTGTNIAVSKPSAVANGDLIIVGIYHDVAGVSTVPTGWTACGAILVDDATDYWLRLYWKRASSEGTSWTWVISASGWWAYCVAAYTGGLASGDAIDGTPTTAYSTYPATTVIAPSITTTVDGAMLVAFLGNFNGDAWSSGEAPITNERADANGGAIYDGIQAAAGTSGTKTFTKSGNLYTNGVVMAALKPAAAAADALLAQEFCNTLLRM